LHFLKSYFFTFFRAKFSSRCNKNFGLDRFSLFLRSLDKNNRKEGREREGNGIRRERKDKHGPHYFLHLKPMQFSLKQKIFVFSPNPCVNNVDATLK